MTITATGEYRADTVPLSSALTETDPIATPIEKINRNRLATSLLAFRTFLARGGNWMKRPAPMVQKKLIAMMARKTLRSWLVRSEERRVGKEGRSRGSPYH